MKGEETYRLDGVLAKYLTSKGMPDVATLTIKRLAKYMKNELGIAREDKRLLDSMWLEARTVLRTALASHKLQVGEQSYFVRRVEAYPDYEILFEREGAENNGFH